MLLLGAGGMGRFRLGLGVIRRGGDGRPLLSAVTISNEVLPQRPQNFAPAANREPHFAQATIAGVLMSTPETLPRLPPFDGDSPLDAADLNWA